MVKKKTKKAKCLWQKRILTRVEFVDTITGMCERLVESDLLERDDLADLEEGLAEDDLTAERLTDLFCDAIEVIDANKMSGELDADVADFYEDAPWNELPDEGEEEEVQEEQEQEEPEEIKEKPKKKKKVKSGAKTKQSKTKSKKQEKKSIVKKESKNKSKKQKQEKKEVNKVNNKKTKQSKKSKVDKSKKKTTKEVDEFGFKVGCMASMFMETIKNKPMTMKDVMKQKWNKAGSEFYGTFGKLRKDGIVDKTADGFMYIVGSKAAKKL